MRETLFIRFPAQLDELLPDPPGELAVQWSVRGPDGALQAGVQRGQLAQAARQAAGRRLVLLLPGEEILLTEVELPTTQRQRALRAVPYALEEQLADDVEGLHFALGPHDPQRGFAVAVVRRTLMRAWTEACSAVDLHPDALVPEVLALPQRGAAWTLIGEGPDRYLLRHSRHLGLVIEGAALAVLLAEQLAGEQPPAGLCYYPCEAEEHPAWLAGLPASLTVERQACPSGATSLLVRGYREVDAINLMQGEFSRRQQFSRLWRPWRGVAALLGIGLLIGLAGQLLEYQRLSAERERLQAGIKAAFTEALPRARHVIGQERTRLQQQLAQLKGGGSSEGPGFLGLFAQAAPVLAAEEQIELNGFSYREGLLDLDVEAASFQVLDAFKARLADTGLAVDIQSASAGNDRRVRGRVRLGPA